MSVTMTFYSNFNKRENSTKQPTGGTDFNVVFKEDFSIYGGTVKLQVSFDTAQTYTAAKYGNKYYKVTDVVSTTNNIVEIDLSLDVLATYKSDIAAYTSMLERSPSDVNIVDIADNTIAPLPTNTKSYKTANVYSLGVSFQIMTQNGEGHLAYFLDLAGFNNLLSKFEAAFWTDETKYIDSFKVVPISASACGGSATSAVYIGKQNYNITAGSCYVITANSYEPLGSNTVNMSDITTKYTDERRYNNDYVKLQCKMNGDVIDLDANYLRYSSFKTASYIDPITLDVRIEIDVYDGTNAYLIASTHTNVGIGVMFKDVPNAIETVVAAMSGISKSVVEKGTGSLPTDNNTLGPQPTPDSKRGWKAFRKGMSGSIGKAYGGLIFNAAAAAISSGYNAGMNVNTAGTPSGSSIAAVKYGEITFYVTSFDSIDKNPSELGYPYMEITNINTVNMTGFYKFVAPQLGLAALADIKDAVNEHLASGFFYE